MSLTEWAVRLGIVTMEEAVGMEFRSSERGVPNKHCTFDGNEAWAKLAGEDVGSFNANKSAATLIKDPVLRLLQVYLGYNLLGQECCITKVTLTELYFIWKAYMHEAVNLAFWTAYQIHQINKNRTRHYSVCHILGAFLARNMHLVTPPSVENWEIVPLPTSFNMEFMIFKLIARMKRGKPEVICTGEANPRPESPDVQVHRSTKKVVKSNKKMVDEGQKSEKKEGKEKQVGQLLKEQISQRDVIDRMQGLIQDLVRVLKESNIQVPAAVQHVEEKLEDSTNNPKKTDEILTDVEEEQTPEPETVRHEDEGPVEEEEKAEPEEENKEEASEQDEKDMAESHEAEAVVEEEREVDPIDKRAMKKRKRREMRAAARLQMKEKLRAMRRKARRRAEKKRAAAAAAKKAAAEPSEHADPQPEEASPIRIKKRKDRESTPSPPPKDSSLRSKRRR